MARRTFELSTTLPVPPEAAVDFLMDLEHHRGLHPYLVAARVVGSGTGPQGDWWDWSVHERPRLGPLRYPLVFATRMTRTSARSLLSEVRAAPGCRLRSEVVTEATPVGCTLVETTEATAPGALVGYLARQARLAHERTILLLPAAVG